MTEPQRKPGSGYERLLDDFGADLARAAAKPPRRRGRAAALAGVTGAVAVAATVALLAAPGGGGQKLDVIAEARAALVAPAGAIVHAVFTQTVEPADGGRASTPERVEQWSAADPTRWRVRFDMPRGDVDVDFADGVQRTFSAEDGTMEIVRGHSDDDGAPQWLPGGSAEDPTAALRAMLGRGELRDAGTGVVAGRSVRRLLSEPADGADGPPRVEYAVDAATFAPVRIVLRVAAGGRINGPTAWIVRRDVERFERIPLDGGSASLLRIEDARSVRTIERQAPAEER